MKKRLISLAVAALLFNGTAQSATQNVQESTPETDRQEAWGLGIGSVAGMIIAGPPGLIAGSILGGLIGQSGGLQDELDDARQALAHTRTELTRLETRQSQEIIHVASMEASGVLDTPVTPAPQTDLLKSLVTDLGLDVYFRTGSADIEPFYQQRLTDLADLLLAVPNLNVQLEGYADRRGSNDDNLRLSNSRIDAVRARLTEAGIASERIQFQAIGEQQPVTGPGDLDVYAFDRRVGIRFLMPLNPMKHPVAKLGEKPVL